MTFNNWIAEYDRLAAERFNILEPTTHAQRRKLKKRQTHKQWTPAEFVELVAKGMESK